MPVQRHRRAGSPFKRLEAPATPRADPAYHEAAHAVVAFVLDIPLHAITIVADADSDGSVTHPAPMMVDESDPTPASRDKLGRAMAMVSYAGRAADRIRGCEEERKYAADDETAWNLICEYVRVRGAAYVGDEAYRRLADRLRTAAAKHVQEHWYRIEKLARVLLKRKTMTWTEAGSVIE